LKAAAGWRRLGFITAAEAPSAGNGSHERKLANGDREADDEPPKSGGRTHD
jgi:hypothetical protein